jgi:hypothetical protein
MPRIISNESEYIRSLQDISNPIEADILTNAADILTNAGNINDKLSLSGGTLTGNLSTNSTITSTSTSGVISTKYSASEGLVETPSYSFTGYSSTGIYHDMGGGSGGERLLFGIGGNRRIFLSEHGGIGFTTGTGNGDSIFTMFPDSVMTYKDFTPSGLNIGLGTSSLKWDSIWARTTTISTSDARNKRDVLNLTLGLNFIGKLNPVSYIWTDDEEFDEGTQTMRTVTHSRRHLGMIAQDIHVALTECGEDLFTTDILSNEYLINQDAKDQYGVRYEMFIPCLINSIKELSAQVSTLKTRIEVLESA